MVGGKTLFYLLCSVLTWLAADVKAGLAQLISADQPDSILQPYVDLSTPQGPEYDSILDPMELSIERGRSEAACGGGTRGDINCNGIAFEIADAVMFINYFMVGTGAFGSHVSASVAASDANYDGRHLSVADFAYMACVIHGDAPPRDDHPWDFPLGDVPLRDLWQWHKSPPDVVFRNRHGAVTVSTDVPLGAVWLVFDGNVAPLLLVSNMAMSYSQNDAGQTSVFIYSLEGEYFESGDLLAHVSKPVSVEAATAKGGTVRIIPPELLPDFELHLNYPNPFNLKTKIRYEVYSQMHVHIAIYNVAGQKVRTLVDQTELPVYYSEMTWDGRDDAGNEAASGPYFCRMTDGKFTITQKMMLLK